MLLRWAVETCVAQGAAPIVAAADPQNRSLKNYMEVERPPANDATATSRWLEALLRHSMEQKASAMVDLGGGDTSLHKLLSTVPDLSMALDDTGSRLWPSTRWVRALTTWLRWHRSRRWVSDRLPPSWSVTRDWPTR
jgi:hypothetical protein